MISGGEVFDLVLQHGGELAHPERAMVQRNVGVGTKGVGGQGDLLACGVFGEGFEAAKELVGRGIDRFDCHDLSVMGPILMLA